MRVLDGHKFYVRPIAWFVWLWRGSIHIPLPMRPKQESGPSPKALPLNPVGLAAERVVPLRGFEPLTPSLRKLWSAAKKALHINVVWH